MDKLDYIEDYFASIRAYYLFQIGKYSNKPEYMGYILDKRCLNGTKVAFLSNLMLAIKENLVDNKGNMQYQSKVFLQSLENSVSYMATKVEDGYKLGNYIFPDAATLVAIVRNKLAHGKYVVDFEHNRVILNHKGVDIVINIDSLVSFVLMSFTNTFKDKSDMKYERNILYYIKTNTTRTNRIKDLSEVKRIIKNYNYVSFSIESKNGFPVFKDCIQYLEGFIKYFGRNPGTALKSDYYRNLVNYLDGRNCKLKVEYKVLRDNDEIDKILDFANKGIIGNYNLSYDQQIKILGLEVQKILNGYYRNFNALTANIGNIILLDAINNVNSVDDNKLSSYIGNLYQSEIRFGYDEYGMTLLAMFNSLFIYPFDDVYDTSGEYSVNRNDGIDFSILDLSMITPTVINIDETPLINAKAKLDSLENKRIELMNKINVQQTNLGKISGKTDVIARINKNINELNNSLSIVNSAYVVADNEYNAIKNDFTVNRMYFYNKAIIEGIRNSIAHGHYEIISKSDFMNTEILFNDIYEGKLTFQVRMTFAQLEELIDNNYMSVLNFVKSKNVKVKK